jgi:hypothetical protein
MEAETLLRSRLMQSDQEFNRLLNDRIAIDAEMQKRWPKAFLNNPAAATLKQRLLAEDAEFKTLNTRAMKARKAEMDYLLKQNPELAELRKAMLSAAQPK